jgi:predicted nucleic acid-binding protein
VTDNAQVLKRSSEGKRLETGDAWIVATALHRKIPLLTHDRDQATVVITGLEVIS